MKRFALLPVLPALSLLAACSTAPSDPALSVVEAGPGQLNYMLASGEYNCERGERLAMQRPSDNQNQLHINWNGSDYQFERDPTSSSGLPRYEDRANGLVWIELPWKGVLLDGKTNRPLANECQSA